MSNEFRIRILIDGRDAEKQAVALRGKIDKAITSAGVVEFDLSAVEKLAKTKGLKLGGAIQIQGLEDAEARLKWLREQEAHPFALSGRIDIEGLKAARTEMAGIRTDAGAIGRAIGAGLSAQWTNLQGKLVDLQSQITGIVRAGESTQIAPDMLEAMPELEAALASGEKKALDLTLKMGDLNARIRLLNESFAELGRTRVQPLAGGEVRTLGELFKGIAEPYHRGKIRKAVAGIDAELAPLAQQVEQRIQAADAAASRAAVGLTARIAEVQTRMEQALAKRPQRPADIGSMQVWQEDLRQWEAGFAEMETQFLSLNAELGGLRDQEMAKGAGDLQDKLVMRRQQLQRPLQDEYRFWEEWSSGSVVEISNSLRAVGQSAAAEALQQMHGVFQERKRLQTQLKRAFGGLQKGAEVELPKGAEGTMVDFIAAEKALGVEAGTVTDVLSAQGKAIKVLVAQMDAATLAAQGMGRTQRYAVEQMEKVGRREMRGATKAGIPLEEASESVRAIMVELTTEAAKMHQQMAEALESPEVVEGAKRTATGVVRVWKWVRDVLVGHSIIPDMVREIEVWLASVGEQSPFTSVVTSGEDAAQQIVTAFSKISSALPAEEVAMQMSMLQTEIRSLEREFNSMMIRGTEASDRYQQEFQETADIVRQVLGSTPDVEGKLAQGMLPKGFGVGAGESIWQKGGGEARKKHGTSREGDVWYQALNVEVEEIKRQNTEEMDRLAALLVSKQAQLSALSQSQLLAMSEGYERAISEAEGVAPTQAGQLVDELSQTYDRLGAAQNQMNDAVLAVNEQAAIETEQEAARVAQEAKAFARTETGRALAQATRAETEERIAAARAEGEVVKQEARSATQAVIQGEKRLTAEVVAQAKYRQRQKEEAAKRATLKAKAIRQTEIEDAKATAKALVEASRAEKVVTGEGARAAGKERAQAAMRETVELRAQVKERQRLQRLVDQQAKAQERLTRQEGTARQMAAQLGIQWDTYIQKAMEAGVSLEEITGTLRRIQGEQRAINRAPLNVVPPMANSRLAKFGKNLSQARMQAHGLHMVLGDLNRATRTIQFASTALGGSLVMAGRSWIEYTKEADMAARSFGLSRPLTEELRAEIIGLSTDMGLLDPTSSAKAVSIWAAATQQEVDSTEDLRGVLQQVSPMIQAAALYQEDLGTVTAGTASILAQFGMELGETEDVTARVSYAAEATLASFGSLTESLKMVGPSADMAGVSLGEVLSTLMVLSEKGMQGTMAGRAIGMMLADIQQPSKAAAEEMEKMFGEESPFYDAQGEFIGIARMVDKIASASADLTQEQRDYSLGLIFDQNALRAVNSLLSEQIVARESGVNVIRAQEKLMDGIVDAETEAFMAMKEREGLSIPDMNAFDLWEQRLEDFNESEQLQVQQMELRWNAMWLTLGKSVTDYALPHIKSASDALAEVNSWLTDHPQIGGLAAVAAGGLAVGTIMKIVVTTLQTVTSLSTIGKVLKATMTGQQAAGTKFQGQVVSAAESFSSIITAAAKNAAAIEETSAKTEGVIEKTDAVAEGSIEKTDAVAEGAIEKTDAVAEGVIENEGAVAEAVIENEGAVAEVAVENAGAVAEVAVENTGAVAEAAIEVASAVASIAAIVALPPLLALAFVDALSRTELGEKLGVQSAGKYVSVAAYGLGSLIGGEETGQDWFTSTATAMGEIGDEADQTVSSLSSLDAMLMGLGEHGVMLPTILQDYDDALKNETMGKRDAATATEALTGYLEEATNQMGALVEFSEKEEKAIDLYVEMLKEQEEALDSFNDALADALADLNAELADMDAELASEIVKVREDARQSEIDAERKFNDQQAKNHAAHVKRLRRMEEDHLFKMVDLARTRDAYGMMKEKQRHDLARARAVEDYEGQANQRVEEHRKQQDERRRQAEERITEMRVEHEAEKAERLAAYEEQKGQLLAEHEEDMAQLEQEYFDKINAELEHWKQSAKQQNDWMAAMLADADIWLGRKRDLWLDYVRNLPTPQYGAAAQSRRGGEQEYQHGGYTVAGVARVHAGEFVLDPETTSAAERFLGPLTQAKLVDGLAGGVMGGGRGGTTIRATMRLTQDFSFAGSMSVEERQWFRQVARAEAEAAFQDTMRGVVAMRGG